MCRTFELRVEDTTITVVGELDLATAPAFRRAVGGLLVGDAPLIVVDLEETDFIDSSGLGALVWALFRSRAAGGDLVAVNATPTLRQIIFRSGLADLIPQAAADSTSTISSGSRAAHSAV